MYRAPLVPYICICSKFTLKYMTFYLLTPFAKDWWGVLNVQPYFKCCLLIVCATHLLTGALCPASLLSAGKSTFCQAAEVGRVIYALWQEVASWLASDLKITLSCIASPMWCDELFLLQVKTLEGALLFHCFVPYHLRFSVSGSLISPKLNPNPLAKNLSITVFQWLEKCLEHCRYSVKILLNVLIWGLL